MKTKIAWAAGLFDGEGCISIGRVCPTKLNGLRNPSYRLTVKVTMGDAVAVRRFAGIIGVGSVQNHVNATEKLNGSISWVAMARKGETAIKKILPFLVTKRKEAIIALRFMALPDVARGGSQGSPRIDAKLLKKKHVLYVECCKAKSRFRFRENPLPKFTHV